MARGKVASAPTPRQEEEHLQQRQHVVRKAEVVLRAAAATPTTTIILSGNSFAPPPQWATSESVPPTAEHKMRYHIVNRVTQRTLRCNEPKIDANPLIENLRKHFF